MARAIAVICILLPFVLHQRGKPLRTQQFKWLVFRSATGTLAMMFSIYAIARLPLATATTLSFTRPMWISLIAFVVLKEPMGWRKLAALALSISGVLWMLQPSAEMPDLEAAIADIGAAFLFAASLVSIRYMTATGPPLTIAIYGQLLGLLFTAPLAIWYWRSPDLQQAYILLSVGAVGVCTMACHVKALQAADASVVGPYEYLRLPFAMVAGNALLGEVPGWFTLVGAGLIVSGALIAAMATRTRSPKFKAEPPIEFQLPENHRWLLKELDSVGRAISIYSS
ncbi:MAG: DMT family transporter [Sphingomonadales bacterium]|nr:DMT family transporter [Sphingomonadales bacterium]